MIYWNMLRGRIFLPVALLRPGITKNCLRHGSGRCSRKGVAEVEENAKGRSQIIITEIPYALNKESLIIKIADLVRERN